MQCHIISLVCCRIYSKLFLNASSLTSKFTVSVSSMRALCSTNARFSFSDFYKRVIKLIKRLYGCNVKKPGRQDYFAQRLVVIKLSMQDAYQHLGVFDGLSKSSDTVIYLCVMQIRFISSTIISPTIISRKIFWHQLFYQKSFVNVYYI